MAADLVDPEPLRQARNPVALLQIPGEVADRVEAPGGGFAREADRFERDRDLRGPAPRARRSRRQPVGVPGDVPRAPVVRPAFVLLGPQRVDHEHVGVVVVVERVEDEGHGVVLPDLAVPPGDRPGDGLGIRISALDPEIDHPLVIEDTNDGALRGGRAHDWLKLCEPFDGAGPAPSPLLQRAVDFDRLLTFSLPRPPEPRGRNSTPVPRPCRVASPDDGDWADDPGMPPDGLARRIASPASIPRPRGGDRDAADDGQTRVWPASGWQMPCPGPASSVLVSRSRAMPTGGRRSKPSPRFSSSGGGHFARCAGGAGLKTGGPFRAVRSGQSASRRDCICTATGVRLSKR